MEISTPPLVTGKGSLVIGLRFGRYRWEQLGIITWVGWIGSRLARRFQQLILSDRFPPPGKHSHRPNHDLPNQPTHPSAESANAFIDTDDKMKHFRSFGRKTTVVENIESQLICRCPPNGLVMAKSASQCNEFEAFSCWFNLLQ